MHIYPTKEHPPRKPLHVEPVCQIITTERKDGGIYATVKSTMVKRYEKLMKYLSDTMEYYSVFYSC